MLSKLIMGGDGLPSEETFLVNETSRPGNLTIEIPKNVKVLKVYTKGYYRYYGEDDYNGYSRLYNRANYTVWQLISGYVVTKAATTYIGVTAGKQYSLYMDYRAADIQNFTISYSAAINQQTPTVTDY